MRRADVHAGPGAATWEWCEAMLPAVSRTFALCIRYLPEDLRRGVTLSYLLCRVADTVEDAVLLTPQRKGELLGLYGSALGDPDGDLSPFATALPGRDDADALLTCRAAEIMALFHAQPLVVREAVAPWVADMCRGMAEFASRKPEVIATAPPRTWRGLRTERELERYCYFVAGTVGHLLTALFAALRPGLGAQRVARMEALAEDFGAGLQLVNILADVARDHERGVSYVPAEACAAAGLAAFDLLQGDRRHQARGVLVGLAEQARRRLRAAREYCQLLPRAEYQLRLFCLIPYFLALRTLRALHEDPVYPAAGQRVKVGRRTVRRTLVAAQFCAASNHLLRAYSQRLDGAACASQQRRSA